MKPAMLRRSLFTIVALLIALPARADFVGRVVAVHDGDSLTILTLDNRQVKIRAADIDAPELGQPFGNAAKHAMSDLVYGKQVTITGDHPDMYGRTVGRIVLSGVPSTGTTAANVEMVRQGMAWVFTRYNGDPTLPGIEAEARAAHRGLWQDPEPMPPWVWRRSQSRTDSLNYK